jgi:hypothetical protein
VARQRAAIICLVDDAENGSLRLLTWPRLASSAGAKVNFIALQAGIG